MNWNKFISIMLRIPGWMLGIAGLASIYFILINLEYNTFINLEADGTWVYVFKLIILWIVGNYCIDILFEKQERKKEVKDA